MPLAPTVTLIRPSFASGELAPGVWGRVEASSVQQGCSVMRNVFVSRKGPASSRAGTLFCGISPTPAGPGSLPPVIVTFQFNVFQSYILEFGVDGETLSYMRVIADGAYVTEAPIAVTTVSNTNPVQVTVPASGFAEGDSVFAAGFTGTTELNARTFVVGPASGDVMVLLDLFGRPLDGRAYGAWTGGGTLARIYTNHQVPYRLKDLPYLKLTESADVMTLCCVNQEDGTEYPPADLARHAPDRWDWEVTTFASAIAAPTNVTAVPSTTTAMANTGDNFVPAGQFSYVVTAVNANGEESVASPEGSTPATNDGTESVDIGLTEGSITVSWSAVSGAVSYNVYKASPAVWNTGAANNAQAQVVPIGSAFGFIGSTAGTSFVDGNIVPDFTYTPPLHTDPFARGTILFVTPRGVGNGYTQSRTTARVVSATGSGAVILPVVTAAAGGTVGSVTGYIVQNGGVGYQPGDQLVVEGDGSGAAGTVDVGPEAGTWPMTPGYFQGRRAYGATLNNPDTLYLSQTGAYTNMDAAQPPIDSDAIVLTPWGQQVNTVQWLENIGPGGLVVGTGLDVWQVSGAAGQGSPLTPASESAVPQENNGFSPTVAPMRANYSMMYVQEMGSTVRDSQYNFFSNVYAGQDLSVLSNHLFMNRKLVSATWARIPWQMVWAVRDDGKFLSLTYDKELQLVGWARHDTQGLVMRVASASEPPVDAPYFVVQRYIPGVDRWVYYIERMQSRSWDGPEAPWCIDCGLELAQNMPDAALSVSAARGPGTITGGYLAQGGSGYRFPRAYAVDPTGRGSGFGMALTVDDGVITGFTILAEGSGYSPATQVVIKDAIGEGAAFVPVIANTVTCTASAPAFAAANVGDVIRIGGGRATVTTVLSETQVQAEITVPVVKTIPGDPDRLPVPAKSGDWSITTPVTTIDGLDHLEGMTVTGIADGEVIPPSVVTGGRITLPHPASSVKVGLGFTAQLQALHMEIPSQGTIQGKRKTINGVTVRMEKTRGITVGANQPVASALDYQEEVPWRAMAHVPEVPRVGVPDAALPMFSGDRFVPIVDDWANWNGYEAAPAMVAVQQTLPLPMNIAALVPTFSVGDQEG